MEIKLTRIARRKDYTIGRMEIDNEYICDTLEPTWRDLAHGGRKQKGKTAIPEGRYALVVTKSPKFKKWLHRCSVPLRAVRVAPSLSRS